MLAYLRASTTARQPWCTAPWLNWSSRWRGTVSIGICRRFASCTMAATAGASRWPSASSRRFTWRCERSVSSTGFLPQTYSGISCISPFYHVHPCRFHNLLDDIDHQFRLVNMDFVAALLREQKSTRRRKTGQLHLHLLPALLCPFCLRRGWQAAKHLRDAMRYNHQWHIAQWRSQPGLLDTQRQRGTLSTGSHKRFAQVSGNRGVAQFERQIYNKILRRVNTLHPQIETRHAQARQTREDKIGRASCRER